MYALALVGLIGFSGCKKGNGDHKKDMHKHHKNDRKSHEHKQKDGMKHKNQGSSKKNMRHKNNKKVCSVCHHCMKDCTCSK